MAPALEHIFTMRLYRSESDTLPLGTSRGSGVHIITPYSSGYLRSTPSSSTPINATLLQGSSNSIRLGTHAIPAPTTYLDARVHFREDTTGAAFSVRFEGVARMDDQIQKILDGSPKARTTESKEHYEFIQPVFMVSREEDR